MPSMSPARDRSVDLARGLACLLMVQTHAFHGWVSPAFHAEAAFVATRWLGTFPLPGFLLLAGVGVALRLRASLDADRSSRQVRRALIRRGLEVLALAYMTNLIWALIGGSVSLRQFLRADVLHAIGLSLLAVALLVVRPLNGAPDFRRVMTGAAWLTLVIGVATPFLTRVTRDTVGPLRYVVAPFSEVPGLTAMPVFPLAAWCALGVVTGIWMTDQVDVAIRIRRINAIGAIGLGGLVLGNYVTGAISAAMDEPLSRASVTLWPNIVDGAGRGLCVLWLGAWCERRLSPLWQDRLARYGAASLWIYAVHIPFCYGRLAAPLRAKLSIAGAVPLVLLLIVASYGVVVARDWMNARTRGAATLRSSA